MLVKVIVAAAVSGSVVAAMSTVTGEVAYPGTDLDARTPKELPLLASDFSMFVPPVVSVWVLAEERVLVAIALMAAP